MHIKTLLGIGTTSVVFLLSGGIVAAQAVNPLQVSVTPVATSATPGASSQTLGTFTVRATQPGSVGIVSFPIMFTGNGATAASLSGCQVFNATGTALNTGANVSGALSAGAQTLTLNAPLAVTEGTTTLTVRCNVASTTPSGSTFQLSVGAPTVTSTLGINLDVAPSAPAGSSDVALANISLDATRSGTPIRITSLPFSITPGSGTTITGLTDCRIRNTADLGVALNTGANTIVNLGSGVNTFVLDNPFVVSVGTAPMLALTCDVSPSLAPGSSYTVSVAPETFVVSTPTGGSAAAVASPGPNGLPLSNSGTLVVTTGLTDTPTTPGGSTPGGSGGGDGAITPGIPNTGLGGDAASNSFLLASALLVALLGIVYLSRARSVL